jgi:OOP family OmpA-OmpF porin
MFRSALSVIGLSLTLLHLAGPALAQAPLARLVGDRIELLTPITFETADDAPTAEGARVLDEVVRILRLHPDVRIEVGVHTDSTGMDAFNLRVSQARAQAIQTYLVRHGIPAGRIHAEGFGETMPIDSNSTAEGRARNRRVEIRVLPGR